MDQDELSFDECSQKLIHFESEAENYLRDKGIEYDQTQDLDWVGKPGKSILLKLTIMAGAITLMMSFP